MHVSWRRFSTVEAASLHDDEQLEPGGRQSNAADDDEHDGRRRRRCRYDSAHDEHAQAAHCGPRDRSRPTAAAKSESDDDAHGAHGK